MIGKPRSLPDLNFDVLVQIISLLTYQDVACLTRTCRPLRVALSAELPRGEVILEARHLASFLMFASVEDGRDRLSYLQKLILPGVTYDSLVPIREHAMAMNDVKRALLVIFKLAAHNLESLSILDLDVFSFRPSELKKILASLPHLRELEMSGVDKKYKNTLADTLPHLRMLTLGFYYTNTDASPFLKAPQSDLQAVTLCNGTLKDASLSFPTVHTLRASPSRFPGDIDTYTRVFPNVREVILDFPRYYTNLNPEFRKGVRGYQPGSEWPSPFVQNSGSRARFLSRPQKKPDAWPHLRCLRAVGHLVGNLGWAGLTCQVARLETSGSQWIGQELAGVLKELRPRCVVLHPSSFDWPYKASDGGDDRGFRWPQLLALRDAPFVTVILCRSVGEGYAAQPQWVTHFCGHLWQCSISCLLIRVDYEFAPSLERSNRFERWRAAMTQYIPSLKVLLFQVEDEVVLGWAKKDGAGSDWKEIDEGARLRLIASENMCPTSIEPCEGCESF